MQQKNLNYNLLSVKQLKNDLMYLIVSTQNARKHQLLLRHSNVMEQKQMNVFV